jgi:hypothetical protein
MTWFDVGADCLALCSRCHAVVTQPWHDKLRETSAALAEAQRELDELRADRERLDFIITGCTGLTFADDNIADVFFETVAQHEDMRIGFRAAFDAAIREARRGE